MTKRGDSNVAMKEETLLSLLFSMPYVQRFLNTHEQVLHCKKFTKNNIAFL